MTALWRATGRAALALGVLALCVCCAAAGDARRPKKLIQTGWDMPDTQTLRANLAEMETRPFNGVVIQAVGKRDDGQPCQLSWAFLDQQWKQQWFQQCVEDLKQCDFKRFTDNFVLLNANPGSVDWFDDAGWKNIVEHCRIAAWVAKQGGLKGILFDPEPYAPPHAQFSYAAQPQREKHTFEQYCRQARRRGRQVMEAIAAEYPEITFFCYFMNSGNTAAAMQRDPNNLLRNSGYGLLPAFIDGWLDAALPTMTFVDGCESAYRYNSRLDFLAAAVDIKGACQNLVSPENRAKYRAQVQVGYGIYLDAYWNPPTSPWYIDGLGRPRVERLRINTRWALQSADQYVWVYGEKFRWWPTGNKSVRAESWPEALPGCDKALHYAVDPEGYARAEIDALKAAGKAAAANIVRNGDFSAEKIKLDSGQATYRQGGPPAGWHAWQAEDSKGTFTWDRHLGASDKGSARASSVSNGCFLQHHDVAPGQVYAVRAVRRTEGNGDAWLRIRWQTAQGRWTAESRDEIVYACGRPEQWSELLAVVEVPEEAGRLVILLGVGGQRSPEDVAWFDDVEAYRLQ
jgi:hypothetical protein